MKLSLLTDDMIVYIENPKQSTEIFQNKYKWIYQRHRTTGQHIKINCISEQETTENRNFKFCLQ